MFFKRIFNFCSLICVLCFCLVAFLCFLVLFYFLVLFLLFGVFCAFWCFFGAFWCFWCVRNLFVKKNKVVFFFWVHQIAILECNDLDTSYFFVLLNSKEWFFFLKRNNNSNCEIPMSITCRIWKLVTPKHGAIFVQDNPWCECEK